MLTSFLLQCDDHFLPLASRHFSSSDELKISDPPLNYTFNSMLNLSLRSTLQSLLFIYVKALKVAVNCVFTLVYAFFHVFRDVFFQDGIIHARWGEIKFCWHRTIKKVEKGKKQVRVETVYAVKHDSSKVSIPRGVVYFIRCSR